MLGSMLLGGAMRGLYDKPRADPLSAVGLSGVDGLESTAGAGDNDPAACLNLLAARIDGDEPRPAPGPKQRPKVLKATAGEVAVALLLEGLAASGDLSLQHLMPQLAIGSRQGVKRAHGDLPILPLMGADGVRSPN